MSLMAVVQQQQLKGTCLFNDNVSSLKYIAANDRVIWE
jgi:hypothetical protein